jgi:hypothetical protein
VKLGCPKKSIKNPYFWELTIIKPMLHGIRSPFRADVRIFAGTWKCFLAVSKNTEMSFSITAGSSCAKMDGATPTAPSTNLNNLVVLKVRPIYTFGTEHFEKSKTSQDLPPKPGAG